MTDRHDRHDRQKALCTLHLALGTQHLAVSRHSCLAWPARSGVCSGAPKMARKVPSSCCLRHMARKLLAALREVAVECEVPVECEVAVECEVVLSDSMTREIDCNTVTCLMRD